MASGFAELPSHKINYDVGRFAVAPAPPVIPTAEMAAHLAKTINTVAENLSPEQRKLKETQLAILGTSLRAKNQEVEMNDLSLQQARKNMAAIQRENDVVRAAYEKAFGRKVNTNAQGLGPQPMDHGDTSPVDYYGHQSNLDEPGFQMFQSGESDLPDPDEITLE